MTQEVLFAQEGSLGIITLNRPKAMNALTLTMILEMQKQLSLWKENDTIHAVVIRATPGNAFCAGGDIRSLYLSPKHGDEEQMRFFWHEYRLNHFIHHFNKPYISLIDGLVMGGGVGVSLHGSHPVASERFVFAMPETGIGFFPDIGASYLLARCPGHLGAYLGLTGNQVGAHEALSAGLIKKVISSVQMPVVYDALMNEDLSKDSFERVTQCLNRFITETVSEEVSLNHRLINTSFAHSTIAMIRESLQSSQELWAMEIDALLEQKSPLSLKITLSQLQKAQGLSLAQCLQMDYDLVSHFMTGHDFYEGVRALLIDKDKNPQWVPAHLGLVTQKMVEDYFRRSHLLLFE